MAEPFQKLTARCVPLPLDNIDTDQVIPARFLKGTVKTGLGQNLFNDLRYLPDGSPNPEFPLNQPKYDAGKSAKILVAGHNFGCGSSREHAPWALTDFGFRAILAVSFADIFRNNSLKNNLLTVPLPEAVIQRLFGRIEADPSIEITVDLENQQVVIPGEPPQGFDLDPFRKECLLKGLDDIGYTLKHQADIDAYEQQMAKA